jgi:hypothetical protein
LQLLEQLAIICRIRAASLSKPLQRQFEYRQTIVSTGVRSTAWPAQDKVSDADQRE